MNPNLRVKFYFFEFFEFFNLKKIIKRKSDFGKPLEEV